MSKHQNPNRHIIPTLLCCGISITVANAQLYGEGYTILNDQNTPSADLTQTILRAQINASTIQDGLHRILNGTGWRLSDPRTSDPELWRLMQTPWPQRWLTIGPDQLGHVLNTIGGEGWQLTIDPVNRMVSYEVKSPFRGNR